MKIYLDLLFLFNVWIDFFLLLLVKLVLKRIAKLKNIFISSMVGGLTTFVVFLNINYIFISILKIFLSFLLVIISFGYKDMIYTLKNMIYLFMVGVIFGGIATLLKININTKTIYLITLTIFTPVMILFFYKQNQEIKKQLSLYYEVNIYFDDSITSLGGFLDSGNKIKDPITKKPIIIVYEKKLKGINKIRSPMYVPIKTLNNSSLIKCYKPDKLVINDKEYHNYLIGITKNKINIDGIDCLLNNQLLEDL